MTNLKEISTTVLTKNSSRYLKNVLDALKPFGEVVVYDNGSTDDTLEIAKCYDNVSLYQGPFLGFGKTHNKATGLAKYDWVLSIDSDEIVTEELVSELNALKLDNNTVYAIPRHNLYNGKHIKWCGWHPDYQYRLYHRNKTSFTEANVHEQVIIDQLGVKYLKSPITHYSYQSLSDFLAKMQHYSELFAEQNKGIKKASPSKAVLHGLFAFIKSYVIKRGFMGGYEGFIISKYNAHTAFYKYMLLYEKNQLKK